MQFSESEKHFLLGRAYFQALPYVQKMYGDSVVSEFFEMAFSSLTNDAWEKLKKTATSLNALYWRRNYELLRFQMTQKGLDTMFEEEPHIVDSIELKDIPLKTIQIAMYVMWSDNTPKKEDIDGNKLYASEDEYERRKDWHDWLFGYANQEACQDPLIDIDDVLPEYENQKEIIKNVLGILYRSRNK